MTSNKDMWALLLILSMNVYESHQAGWTAWGKYSACSQTCGSGVKSRERICVEDGTSRKCKGKKFSYRLCNTQECEDGRDFRAAQCEDHNGTPLDGVSYQWKPYYGHGETCELLCYAVGYEFYHKLAEKVIDGTPCHSDGHHICINGSCKSVGCDKKIGSKLRVDACGVCGGDNSTCIPSNNVKGTFEIPSLSPGYNTVLEIPVGARNIFIRDLGENRNPLVFWDSTRNTFNVDKQMRKSENTVTFAGTSFTYTPDSLSRSSGEIIAKGPTDEPITLYIVNKGFPNPGIQYGYTVLGKSESLPLAKEIQNIVLKKDVKLAPAEPEASVVDRYLEQLGKSDVTASINLPETNVRVSGPTDSRVILPQTNVRVGRPTDSRVLIQTGDDDIDFSYLRGNSERYWWSFGHWAPCSNGCGTGEQRRVVSCIDRVERKPTDPSNCDYADRPSSTQPCTNNDCLSDVRPGSYVQWKPGQWGACSTTCDLGVQTQRVSCEAVHNNGRTTQVDDELCLNEYKAKPQYRRSCNDDVPCDRLRYPGMWRFSGWSQCSRSCGRGQQSRRVVCWGRSFRLPPLPASDCDPQLRPVNKKLCFERECPPSLVRQRTCRNTYYGCCPDGYNAARGPNNMGCPRENIKITEDDARVTTHTKLPHSKCQQPSLKGDCQDYVVRWFHNGSLCTRFWYGGCGGNENNFETEDQCQQECSADEDVCRLPSFTGRCKARHPRWYYNTAQRECQQFIYGGCGGNGNRFRTKVDCERQCLSGTKALGDERVLCKDSRFGCCPDGVTVALGNNNEGCPNSCQDTVYGCCDDDITAAQGPNQEGCEEIEISSGDGADCDQSTYGCCPDGVTMAQGPSNEGCDGVVVEVPDTDVYYPDREERVNVDVTSAQCRQSSDFGTCRDDPKVMWFYNTSSSRCQRFWYGGCDGNDNRFKSEKECLTTCRNVIERETTTRLPVCHQPKEVGPCFASIPRWYHNLATRRCEEFTYGGCRGNQNNFASQRECENYCGVRRGTPETVEPDEKSDENITISKPGECLATDFGENCYSSCRYDGDCPGNQKCCADRNSCSRCVDPGTRTEIEVLRPTEVCSLPKEIGPCRAAMPRWYYNPDSQLCEQFTYGGCEGNKNNFETEETCRRYCRARVSTRTRTRQPVCEMTPDYGPCRSPVSKWNYNITTLQCDSFTYGGCLGNHNNFETETKCMAYCGLRHSGTRQDDCLLQKEVGNCRGNIPRWYYDARSGRCYEFSYGGCQGNGNNFGDESSCYDSCRGIRVDEPEPVTSRPPVVEGDICALPLETPCDNSRGGVNWYYDSREGVCKEVPEGGCNKNRNNFQSREQCEGYCSRERVCQPLTYSSDIRCLAAFRHWTYNRDSGECEEFTYGGCGGSANNFPTKEACSQKCGARVVRVTTEAPEPMTPDEICALPEDSGNCLAYNKNWRYDNLDGTCKEFTFGGCGGNKNNFGSRGECERFCGRTAVCREFQEPEVTCLAYMPRWRYIPRTGQCENFIYGGCGGNANNFETFEACENKCIVPTRVKPDDNRVNRNRATTWMDICNKQADVGPCTQYIKRWYYNSITRDCEEFTYGGCVGNHNNFESRMQCMTYCDSSRFREPTEPEPTEIDIDIVGSGEIPDEVVGVGICALANETGVCEAYIPSYFYDHMTGQCRQFIYGGCGGNQNRFSTREDCEAQCSAQEICRLPQVSGRCMSYKPRYFFDWNAGVCREFVYGGCEGNANNFDDVDACERTCAQYMNRPPDPKKPGQCPRYRNVINSNGKCETQCRVDVDCRGNEKCCVRGCSLLCLTPITNIYDRRVKPGYCPARSDWGSLLGACAPQCQYDSDCDDRQKCCHRGCGLRCVSPLSYQPYQMDKPMNLRAQAMSDSSIYITWYDPALERDQLIRDSRFYTVRYYSFEYGRYEYKNITEHRGTIDGLQSDMEYNFEVRSMNPPYLSEWSEPAKNKTMARSERVRPGYCPRRTDWGGLLGACAPQCNDDSDCDGRQKCCHQGCGLKCVDPLSFEPYQLERPVRLSANTMSDSSIYLSWYDPALSRDQIMEEDRYYTVRYYSYDIGSYKYMNMTSLRGAVDGLRPAIEYNFEVRSMMGNLLSEWSEPARNRTAGGRESVKPGYCPVKTDRRGLLGACAPQCQYDYDCEGSQKCCHQGCSLKCVDALSYEPYQWDKPIYVQANTLSDSTIQLQWYDPALERDQVIRDDRFYTVRYFSNERGEYPYMNTTDQNVRVENLEANTEYFFEVRSMNQRYRSEWSEQARNRTSRVRVTLKAGQCPRMEEGSVGLCYEECSNDGDCAGDSKCCSNGCGHVCMNPEGYDICSLPTDAGSCSNWEVRWFFNSTMQRCDRFWYGGCNEGNRNNFVNESECVAQCGPEPRITTPRPYDCRRSLYGCCNDRYTPKRDQWGSNCRDYEVKGCRYGETCGGSSAASCPPGYTCIVEDRNSIDQQGVCCAQEDNTTTSSTSTSTTTTTTSTTTTTTTTTTPKPETEELPEYIIKTVMGDAKVVPVTPGKTATLVCNYGNTDEYSVLWYRDGKLLETSEGRTVYPNGTLVVYEATIEDDGSYACHVRHQSQLIPTIYRFQVQVEIPIGILPGPDTIMVKPNHMAFLHCEVYGNPKPMVSWRKNGLSIMSDGRYEVFRNGTLLIRRTEEDDMGSYTCEADNGVSTPVQNSMKLTLREMLVARIENDNGRVIEGGRITLRCEGRGYPMPTLTWEKMGRPLATGGNVYISSDGRLVIREATLDDTGTYSCIVANSEEKIETSTSVQVVPKEVMPDKCEDKTGLMKCRLIVTARLCGYRMYSKICCNSCRSYYNDA